MKILYFDCAQGVSGEMLVGALLDLGCDIHFLAKELNRINLGCGYEITVFKTEKCGISASQFEVNTENSRGKQILAEELLKAVSESGLPPKVKSITSSAFLRILKAREAVSFSAGEDFVFPLDKGIKTIVTIAGFAVLLDSLMCDRVVFSPISEGSGFVNIGGRLFSIPEPIVSEILKDGKAAVNFSDVPHELITPEGAAISCEVAESFSLLPSIVIKGVGYGASPLELIDRPAVLRVISGETGSKLGLDIQTDFNMESSGLFFENFGYNMSTSFQKTKEG